MKHYLHDEIPITSAPELRHLENLLEFSSPILRPSHIADLNYKGSDIKVHALEFGSDRDDVPVLFFIGGIHGVERIGSQVVLAFLETLVQRMQWDHSLIDGLNELKIVFIPIANPTGLLDLTRCNHNGVDLMRNAPLDAQDKANFLVGGHRYARWLPWYRGVKDAPMEPEAQGICNIVQKHYETAPITIVLDVHSGFGFKDRLWIPFAGSKEPVPHLAEYYALKKLMIRTYPHLDYIMEPQCHHYITHGDLWDYLYLDALSKQKMLLPITLEMGSWRWVKKNPMQIAKVLGLYNPVKAHRVQRVLRRHTTLMEFLIRATRASNYWLPEDQGRVFKRRAALRHWFESYEQF